MALRFAVAGALLLSALSLAQVARAGHDGGGDCYDCHDLTNTNVEPGTHLLSRSAMAELRSNGWSLGMRPGCTFCHRSVNSTHIPDALTDFVGSWASRHPTGRNFVTKAADNSAYLSSDNTAFPQSLDCKDCHDITLTSFPNHDNVTWTNDAGTDNARKKSTNPYGLRNVSQPKAYDDLCRSCHRSQASFTGFTGKSGAGATKLVLVSHDNGADNGALAIKDLDNTPLRTQVEWAGKRQCNICHDVHFSNNLHLFSDGHEKSWTGAAKAVISETACADVCHFKGDSDNSFDTHGHGKALNWAGYTIGKTCAACHDYGKPHNPGSADYSTRYRFGALDPLVLDNSVFKKPIRSVCEGCHKAPDYPTHDTRKGKVGCLDCHDQHAKYSDNNVMMIRSTNRVAGYQVSGMTPGAGYTIGTEPVLFQKSPKYPGAAPYDNHFYSNAAYRGDNAAGFCDQRACHGAGVASDNVTPLIPLLTLLSTGKHSGGNQAASSNCEACHRHTDGGGSFRAKSSCVTCHGQPPPPADNSAGTVYGYSESYTGHLKHAGPGYAIDCQMCHLHYTDNNYHNTATKTFQSVFFDPSKDRGGASYDNVNLRCQNITCHSDGRGGAPENTTFQWIIPPTPGTKATLHCNDCHRGATNPTRMSSGAHAAHLDSGYACSACHVNTVQDDNVTLNAASGYTYHVNGTRDVSIKGAYDDDAIPTNNWSASDNSCTGITCHGGNKVNWYAAAGSLSCDACHLRPGDVDDFGTGTPGSMKGNGITAGVDNAEWTWSGHGRPAASGNYDVSGNPPADFTGSKPCLYCHDSAVKHDNAANPFRLANYDWGSFGWNGNCQICHSKTVAPSGYNYPGGPGPKVASSGARIDNAHFGAKHVSLDNTGGKFCFDCHDPHGDRVSGSGNIFMIGKRVTMRNDNTYGMPVATYQGDNTYRPAPVFTDNATGASYADNTSPYDGICNVCHTGSLGHYRNDYGDTHNRASRCTTCHSHDANFRGQGGPNIEQFFDNAYRADNTNNYRDLSGHRIKAGTTSAGLYDNNQIDCYSCHGVANTTYKANECLVCHYEYRTGLPQQHPNGIFEWATPSTPSTQLASYPSGTLDNNSALCLACHAVASPPTLNGVTPPDIRQGGETSWTTGSSGHGSVDNLSGTPGVGPPSYHCKACHYSTVRVTGGESRDQAADPGFHGSVNRKLVGNENASSAEYPHPSDTTYTTPDSRSLRLDSWCATKCHRNTTNGSAKDDNVVDHTWDNIAGQSRATQPGASHPSDAAPVPNAQRYQSPSSLPLSDYLAGALPGTGNVACVTCHDPHGGGNITKDAGVPVTGGDKNMLRLSPADNVSTLCKQCHK